MTNDEQNNEIHPREINLKELYKHIALNENQAIAAKEYINYFLNEDTLQHQDANPLHYSDILYDSFAIIGKWGTGKTYFYNRYVKKYIQERKNINSKVALIEINLVKYNDTNLLPKLFLDIIDSIIFNLETNSIIKNKIFSLKLIKKICKNFYKVKYSYRDKKVFCGLSYLERGFSFSPLSRFGNISLTNVKNYKVFPKIDPFTYIEDIFKKALNGKKVIISFDNLDRCSSEFIINFLEKFSFVLNHENILLIYLLDLDIVNRKIKSLNDYSKTYLNKYFDKFIKLKSFEYKDFVEYVCDRTVEKLGIRIEYFYLNNSVISFYHEIVKVENSPRFIFNVWEEYINNSGVNLDNHKLNKIKQLLYDKTQIIYSVETLEQIDIVPIIYSAIDIKLVNKILSKYRVDNQKDKNNHDESILFPTIKDILFYDGEFNIQELTNLYLSVFSKLRLNLRFEPNIFQEKDGLFEGINQVVNESIDNLLSDIKKTNVITEIEILFDQLHYKFEYIQILIQIIYWIFELNSSNFNYIESSNCSFEILRKSITQTVSSMIKDSKNLKSYLSNIKIQIRKYFFNEFKKIIVEINDYLNKYE